MTARVLAPAGPARCDGLLIEHEDGRYTCTRRSVCQAPPTSHAITVRCGACDVCRHTDPVRGSAPPAIADR